MIDPRIYDEIETVFKDINTAVSNTDIEKPDPKEIISHLTKKGGGIEVYSDSFEPQCMSVNDVQRKAQPLYNHAYGIDGSTTKGLTYANGLILAASTAGISVTNKDSVSEITEKNTICVSTYFDDYDLDIDEEYETDGSFVKKIQYRRLDNLNKKLKNWVSSISRSYTEGKQFKWASKQIDEPLFLDGPLLPADLLIWILYHQENLNSRNSPMNNWSDYIQDIMQLYIEGIENCIVSDIPIFGVQKTTSGTRIIDSLKEKEPKLSRKDLPWSNDAELFTNALSHNKTDDTYISYTPWYVERNVRLGNNKRIIPLKNYDDINLKYGSAEEYVRAFFYAKPPTKNTVYRIGVPEMLFDRSYSKEELRLIALSEMITDYSEPLPIVLADKKVRITRDIREKLRKLINLDTNITHNEARNYTGDD